MVICCINKALHKTNDILEGGGVTVCFLLKSYYEKLLNKGRLCFYIARLWFPKVSRTLCFLNLVASKREVL